MAKLLSCKTKPTSSCIIQIDNIAGRCVRNAVLRHVSHSIEGTTRTRWQAQDAVCTAAPVLDRAPPKGWRGRGGRAGNMGFILPRPEPEQKRVRELLTQSRELLKQMQAGLNWRPQGSWSSVHPAFLLGGAMHATANSSWSGQPSRTRQPTDSTVLLVWLYSRPRPKGSLIPATLEPHPKAAAGARVAPLHCRMPVFQIEPYRTQTWTK